MKCPQCNKELKEILVKVHGADSKAVSYQCPACGYFSFDSASAQKVIDEVRSPLKMKQNIVSISQNRLGLYLNNDIIRSLDLKKGEEVLISCPDKKHIVVERV